MKITKILIYLILIFSMSLVLYKSKDLSTGISNKNFIARNLPINSAVGENNGINYYAELSRSFLNGKTYLLGPYKDELILSENPYGGDALAKGLIIQDAAYYKGRYYIYWGPLPVLLYMPFKLIFNFYPSDYLVGISMDLQFWH